MPASWNHTQLCLISEDPSDVTKSEMQPISLCSVHYKIIDKILCERLKRILPEIISETQGAFVSERSITDNILLAHEMVHALMTNSSVSDGYMAIKTDMSKAYDRLEWCFFQKLLEKLGFDEMWINWIMSCVTTVTYSVLLNGRAHGYIKPTRGL